MKNILTLFIITLCAVQGSVPVAAGPTSDIDPITIESQFREFAPIAMVREFIDDTSQPKIHAWISTQKLEARNQQALVFLALGINHKTGIQSGWISVQAISLVKTALQPSIIKTTLDWMYDMLTNPVGKFPMWEKKKELLNTYKEFPRLSLTVLAYVRSKNAAAKSTKELLNCHFERVLKQITEDIFNNNIEGDFVNRFRMYADKLLCLNLSTLISKDKENDLFKIVNLISVRLGCLTPYSYDLGILIHRTDVQTDLRGNPITTDRQKGEAEAECYRLAIKDNISEAFFNLGVLIHHGNTQTDLRGDKIKTGKQKYEAAAECYRLAIKKGGVSNAYFNLGVLIANNQTQTDLSGNEITTDNERYTTASDCFIQLIKNGNCPEAYYCLGVLIENGDIIRDEQYRHVTDKIKTAERLYVLASAQHPKELANFYIRHACGLTETERLSKIESILQGRHPEVLFMARTLLTPEALNVDKGLKDLLMEGCSTETLSLIESREESDDISSESDTLISVQSGEELEQTPVMHKDPIDALVKTEQKKRYDGNNERENGFKSLSARFETIKRKVEEKQQRLQEKVRELVKPKMLVPGIDSLMVFFKPEASKQFTHLDKTEKERFHTLLDAIKNKNKTGHEESLSGKIFEGRPVMTRELGKDDRVAYIQNGNVVTILSLEGHFNERHLALNSNKELVQGFVREGMHGAIFGRN